MSVEFVNSSDFFLQRSSSKKYPNFKSKKNVSNNEKEKEEKIFGSHRGNAYKHTKTGYRKDLDLNLRSNWEANFVRILNGYKIKFEFEPTVFSFPIKRGTKGYTPDFFLTDSNEWIELKGYLDSKSKVKLKRFKRYYPEEFKKLTCVISKYSKEAINFMNELEVPKIICYEDLRSEYSSLIENWEGK
jgi:hypothetical protein